MQVDLVKTQSIPELIGATPSAPIQEDSSFRDTLDDVRQNTDVERPADSDSEEIVSHNGSSETEEADTTSTAPVVVEEVLDESALLEVPTGPVPVATASTLPAASTAGATEVSTVPVDPAQVAVESGATATPGGTHPDGVDAVNTPTESKLPTHTTTETVTKTATLEDGDVPLVAREAAVNTRAKGVTPESTAPTVPIAEGGPKIIIGDYFDSSTNAQSDGKQSPKFFLLDGAATEVSNSKLQPPSEAPVRVETPAPAATPEVAVPVSPASSSPAPAGNPPGGSADAMPNATAGMEAGRASSGEGARAATVLRAEPGDDAALSRRLHQLVRRAVRRGESEVRIRLDPPELGRVDVEVKLTGDRVGVIMQVDDEQVRSAIAKHIAELEAALESYGYTEQEVNIDLRSSDQENSEGEQSSTSSADGSGEDETDLTREVTLDHLGVVMDLKG